MYALEWPTVSAPTRGLNTKTTLEWAQKQLVTRVHILFYFLRMTNPKMTIKTTIFRHRPRVSPALLSFWWWCHDRLLMTSQWPDNCDAITWIMISNSLDIDFIHGDIHGRSCKKSLHSCFSGYHDDNIHDHFHGGHGVHYDHITMTL